MPNVTLISHLSVDDWKASWNDKVVEDTRENMRAYQQQNCYWGHFLNDKEFVICFHKEFEIKSMSLKQNFYGTLEKDPKGCKITGHYNRKKSTNIFLGAGAILCLMAIFGSWAKQDTQTLVSSIILMAVLFVVYIAKPKKDQKKIMDMLQKISFDENFYNKGRRKKKSMKDKAKIDVSE